MYWNFSYLKSTHGILRLCEIILVLLAFCLYRAGGGRTGTLDGNNLAVGIFVTAIIITPLLLACYVMGPRNMHKTVLEMSVNVLLFLFMLVVGAITINDWVNAKSSKDNRQPKIISLSMASFCILAAVAYLADFILSVLKFRE